MEDIKNSNDSFSEVKIHKPKPIRLCPNSKKSNKSSLSSSTSTVNSEINSIQFNIEETKIDLENISIEEINTDFFICSQALEEEQCHEELYDIMNNSMEKENKKENLEKKDSIKVKRCENPLKENLDMMSNSYFDELIDDLNDLCCKENEEGEE
jgi:ATP-dependent protease HslVU (ClpYQ) ATPase subunit